MNGQTGPMLLLDVLRNKLVISEEDQAQFSLDIEFQAHVQLQQQLALIKNIETILQWKPAISNLLKTDIYPSLLEIETTPFRHGPPGCESVIRLLYQHVRDPLVLYLVQYTEKETVIIGIICD